MLSSFLSDMLADIWVAEVEENLVIYWGLEFCRRKLLLWKVSMYIIIIFTNTLQFTYQTLEDLFLHQAV